MTKRRPRYDSIRYASINPDDGASIVGKTARKELAAKKTQDTQQKELRHIQVSRRAAATQSVGK